MIRGLGPRDVSSILTTPTTIKKLISNSLNKLISYILPSFDLEKIMKLSRKHIPFLSRIFNNINQDIDNYGEQKAFHKIITKNGGKPVIKGRNSELDSILQSERAILVANHPHEIEPFVLTAILPSRHNYYVIANVKFLNWLSNLNHHIIPVHIQHHYHYTNRLGLRARLFNLLPLTATIFNQDQAHQENIKSIARASKLVDQGAMVMIFPGVGNKRWFSGIGHMLKNTTTEKPIYFVKTYIKGTCKFDLLRIIPIFNRILPRIEISFDNALKVNYLRNLDGKNICTKLEANYNKWKEDLT